LIDDLKADPMMQEPLGQGKLARVRYYPTTTGEESPKLGRV